METTSVTVLSKNKRSILISLACSVAIILFLFFIDEATFSFNWMKHPGNWIAFLIYLAGFSLGQYLAHALILRWWFKDEESKLVLTSIIGIPLGFGLVLLFFYLVVNL
jgi:hypothetical protein